LRKKWYFYLASKKKHIPNWHAQVAGIILKKINKESKSQINLILKNKILKKIIFFKKINEPESTN
jgi:hypothetical protein